VGYAFVIVDGTECPIELPLNETNPAYFFSGKNKQLALKYEGISSVYFLKPR
jgi:hypothetical protein